MLSWWMNLSNGSNTRSWSQTDYKISVFNFVTFNFILFFNYIWFIKGSNIDHDYHDNAYRDGKITIFVMEYENQPHVIRDWDDKL